MLQHLDDLELVVETTEILRPLSKVHVPSYSTGGSYGFVDKVIDNVSVYVSNVMVTLRSTAFFASIEVGYKPPISFIESVKLVLTLSD
jgi:hypothetical protein